MYLAEGEVLAQWPMLNERELRLARKKLLLTHYAFRSGVCYKPEDVEAYIERTYKRCANGNLAASTLNAPSPIAEASTTPVDMTQEQAASIAEVFAQKISKRRSASSPRSSSPPRPKPKTRRTRGTP